MGVLFNDSSSMLIDQQMETLSYINNQTKECSYYSATSYPGSLHKKVTILKNFNQYMDKITEEGPELPFYMRTRIVLPKAGDKPTILNSFKLQDKVVIFKLSDGQIQAHFNDASVMVIVRQKNIVVFYSP